jgi:hypothetical protein
VVYIEHEHHGAMPAAGQLEDVDRLIWRSPTTDHADLRTSGLTDLVVHSIEGPLTIVLPPTMNGVSLSGDLRSIHLEGLTAPDPSVQLWGEVSGRVSGGDTSRAPTRRLWYSPRPRTAAAGSSAAPRCRKRASPAPQVFDDRFRLLGGTR